MYKKFGSIVSTSFSTPNFSAFLYVPATVALRVSPNLTIALFSNLCSLCVKFLAIIFLNVATSSGLPETIAFNTLLASGLNLESEVSIKSASYKLGLLTHEYKLDNLS